MRESEDYEGTDYEPFYSWESKRGDKIWYGQTVLVTGDIGFIRSKFALGLLTGLKQQIRDQSIEVV